MSEQMRLRAVALRIDQQLALLRDKFWSPGHNAMSRCTLNEAHG